MTRVSIVISTLDRAEELARALESLQWLSGPEPFEVVVVAGPSRDRTDEVLLAWEGRIVRADCPEANLSKSRNIGIGRASGDIVAFMDDDAVPEPEWLAELVPAFDDPSVAAAGGFVFGHDGVSYQYRFGLFDRFGWPQPAHDRPGRAFVFPESWTFPHLIGTNSAYRRSALVAIGGFDEEYEYFLDDTDVVVRLVDRGWDIAQVAGAHVHHKFAASAMRSTNRVAADRRSILKNHAYFGLRHAVRARGREAVDTECDAFIVQQRGEIADAVVAGLLAHDRLADFDGYAAERVAEGRVRAAEPPVLGSLGAPDPGAFVPFTTLSGPKPRRLIVDDPEASDDALAQAVATAAAGTVVHLVRPADDVENRDFRHGVWIHSIVVGDGGWDPAARAEREAIAERFPAASASYSG